MPIFGRDLSQYIDVLCKPPAPARPSEQPTTSSAPPSAASIGCGIHFSWTAPITAIRAGRAVITPNLDSVAELKITTTSYDAEFGQASQAIIASHTKSGTNTLHGSLFEYRRDQHGAARDPFSQAQPIVGTNGKFIPPTLWNQFGGSFGGPIQKDKTFSSAITSNRRTMELLSPVYPLAERSGDSSDLNTPIYNPCRHRATSSRRASSSPAMSSHESALAASAESAQVIPPECGVSGAV